MRRDIRLINPCHLIDLNAQPDVVHRQGLLLPDARSDRGMTKQEGTAREDQDRLFLYLGCKNS